MLNNDNKNKLSFRICNALSSDYVYGTHVYKWFNFVENICNETGFTYVWLSQNIVKYGNVFNIILERLKDQYLQLWRDNIYHPGKGIDYRIFKEIINLERYFLLLNKNHRSIFTHYHTANHRLPIEVGRWELFPEVNENAVYVWMMLLVMNITFYLNAIFFETKDASTYLNIII